MKKKIKIKILNSLINNYQLPKHSTHGSAGLDLRACLTESTDLIPNESKLISTGLALHIDDNELAAIIIPRSGLGHQYGIILGNSIGLIDSDYQGEIIISLLNRSNNIFTIYPGDRIAQIVFIKITQVEFDILNEFDKTKRRGGGFGHTGIK